MNAPLTDTLPRGARQVAERTAAEDHARTMAMPLEEVLDFARRWDPQPFHTDEARAKESPYGGLIASGTSVTKVGLVSVCSTYSPNSLSSSL